MTQVIVCKIPVDPPFIFHTDEEDNIIIPDTPGELQEFLETMWNQIAEGSVDLIPIYNKAAERYNNITGSVIIQILNSKQMAKAKKAAKKKAAVKKPATKKVSGEKKESQLDVVTKLVKEGKTNQEIHESTGIKLANIAHYISKYQLRAK